MIFEGAKDRFDILRLKVKGASPVFKYLWDKDHEDSMCIFEFDIKEEYVQQYLE